MTAVPANNASIANGAGAIVCPDCGEAACPVHKCDPLIVEWLAQARWIRARRDAAISYARHGWRVVPFAGVAELVGEGLRCCCPSGLDCTSPGKHAATVGWLDRGTVDESTIRAWWNGPWWNANVAILTGVVSGVIVLDIDKKSGGLEALDRLEAEHGPLPLTPTQISGGEGRHFVFIHPGGRVPNLTGDQAIRPGVEIKGDGGGLVMAPSRHISGNYYRWMDDRSPDDVRIAAGPAWLLDFIHSRAARATTRRARASRFTPPSDSPRVLAAILVVLQARGPVTGPDRSGNYRVRCISPSHVDAHPSLDVSVRGFYCRSCGLHGGLRALAKRLGLTSAGIRVLSGER